MSSAAKIVFAGTPEFAVPSLRALLASGSEIALVLTQPDRPSGRGRRLTESPVKREAVAHGLALSQPDRLRPGMLEAHTDTPPDLMVVVAYGLLLPAWLLDWPRLGAVNVHASLLPRWRGAAPIQHAILVGDAETGVSLMKIDAGLDTGPVYGTRSLSIAPEETAASLHHRLARLGGELLGELLPELLRGASAPVPQARTGVTHAPRLKKADAKLDWARSAAELERRVRAFNPWPVSEAVTADGRRVRIWAATALGEAGPGSPGTVIAAGRDGIDVATGEGVLRILRLQPPGGKVMAAGAYVNAHSLEGAAFVS